MQDDAAAIDSVRKHARTDGFLRFHEGNYETGMFKEVRAAWQSEIDTIINLVYRLNKPVAHKIEIVKI